MADLDPKTTPPARTPAGTFPDILEAVPVSLVIVGPDGDIRFLNGQAEKLFGYRQTELIGQPIEVLVPERFRPGHAGRRDAYLANPMERTLGSGLDLYGVRRDGSEFPAEISLRPLQTEGGLLVCSAILDVTERRMAEALRFRAAIVDTSNDAIIGTSLDGTIESWNLGAERIFGYRAAAVIGKSTSLLLPPGRRGEEPEIVERLLRGETVGVFETLRRRKDGQDIHASVTVSLVKDARGNVIGASLVARDITERKRAEEALARALEATEFANRELEAFSYSVAHDLRAPLRGIDGFSQALLEEYAERLDGEGRRYLGRLRESAQHMAQLIESLLSLARLTRSELRHEPVDLSALVRSAAERLQAAQPERKVELRIADGLTATGDARLLAILFENLVGNAWKFTRLQPQALIEFGREWDQGRPVFFVRDNGAGFDMAYSSKLFGVFQRLHAAREFEGTGIGLATVQRIVRRHGGRIWGVGKVNGGATLYFFLDERGPRA